MSSSTQAVANLQTEISRLKHELTTMKVDDQIPGASATTTIADYLLERLVQLKVTVSVLSSPKSLQKSLSDAQNIFGVPGDFNLGMNLVFRSVTTC